MLMLDMFKKNFGLFSVNHIRLLQFFTKEKVHMYKVWIRIEHSKWLSYDNSKYTIPFGHVLKLNLSWSTSLLSSYWELVE